MSTVISAHSVLPLAPNGSRIARPTPPAPHDVLAAQVQEMLEREHPLPVSIDYGENSKLNARNLKCVYEKNIIYKCSCLDRDTILLNETMIKSQSNFKFFFGPVSGYFYAFMQQATYWL